MRILIANRGEIAVRIIHTAERLGYETVAAFADPDRAAPHVRLATFSTRLGPAELAESYLSTKALLEAAERTGATAVHPGYGFLSESADAARAITDAGLVWIGPSPQVIDRMGSKIEARRIASRAGLAIIPGFDASQDDLELASAAEGLGFPVLIKASAGGGGKGIRIASSPTDFPAALEEARKEAARAFGDDAVIVERYIARPRHIEVQVVGDHFGNVIDLGTRECSVQRRYQKLLEEAPAPNLHQDNENRLCSAATALARSIGYDSVGTVEFVLDDDTGEAFFLEMNTRLQVEHPVTEAVTGLDLVELQLRIAAGETAPFPLRAPAIKGHAFEARINAEDPFRDFMPQSGTVSSLRVPAGVRWDGGIEVGTEVTPRYDALLGKLIAHGPDRETARRNLLAAIDLLLIGGLRTNTGLHHWLLTQRPLRAARITTRFLDEAGPLCPPDAEDASTLAAAAWLAVRDHVGQGADVWHRLGRRRLTPHSSPSPVFLEDLDGELTEVLVAREQGGYGLLDGRNLHDAHVGSGSMTWTEDAVTHRCPADVDVAARIVSVARFGVTHSFRVRSRVEHWGASMAPPPPVQSLTSPFPAVVAEVHVAAGEQVAAGQVLVVIEAMKMLHSLVAKGPAVVAAVWAGVGSQVASGEELIAFVEAE
jgi:acetyl/propionyl-CoA carboxylase alpha subunit